MPKKLSKCAGKPKGYRYINNAGYCMQSCKKPQYRARKSPYHCVTPKRCPNGQRRHKKSGTCRDRMSGRGNLVSARGKKIIF